MAAELFALGGRTLFGDEWQSPLARKLGMQLRTVQRIAAAAAAGEPYRIADGVMTDLRQLLAQRQADCSAAQAAISDFLHPGA